MRSLAASALALSLITLAPRFAFASSAIAACLGQMSSRLSDDLTIQRGAELVARLGSQDLPERSETFARVNQARQAMLSITEALTKMRTSNGLFYRIRRSLHYGNKTEQRLLMELSGWRREAGLLRLHSSTVMRPSVEAKRQQVERVLGELLELESRIAEESGERRFQLRATIESLRALHQDVQMQLALLQDIHQELDQLLQSAQRLAVMSGVSSEVLGGAEAFRRETGVRFQFLALRETIKSPSGLLQYIKKLLEPFQQTGQRLSLNEALIVAQRIPRGTRSGGLDLELLWTVLLRADRGIDADGDLRFELGLMSQMIYQAARTRGSLAPSQQAAFEREIDQLLSTDQTAVGPMDD
jgi:hypothetical protein